MQLFEYGKTYHVAETGKYSEQEHLALYITGFNHENTWREKQAQQDFYSAKGLTEAILSLSGLFDVTFVKTEAPGLQVTFKAANQVIGTLTEVAADKAAAFDIKQAVYFIDINFTALLQVVENKKITYSEVSKFPAVQRDLALVVNRSTTYEMLENVVAQSRIGKLQNMRLFDVFESDKLGLDKKSMAVNFTFLDEEKTLTDKEIDGMMGKLIHGFEKELAAEIRK